MKDLSRETFVRKFFKDNALPFPVARENMLSYYATIEGYHTVEDDFNDYINKVETVGYSEYIASKDKVEEELLLEIQSNERYKELTNQKIEPLKLPVPVSRDLYLESNCNKSLLSIDMKNANFTILNLMGVVPTHDWSSWVSKFTDEEELVNSKMLRQRVLGKLSNKRIENLMRNEMIRGAQSVTDILSIDRIVVLNKDEVVYDVTGLDVEVDVLLKSFTNSKAEEFKLTKLTYGWVKEFKDGSYTFHATPKKYWLQTYKEYKGLSPQKEDFLFLDESRKLCLRLEE